jgi:hypothetical protein
METLPTKALADAINSHVAYTIVLWFQKPTTINLISIYRSPPSPKYPVLHVPAHGFGSITLTAYSNWHDVAWCKLASRPRTS